MGNNAFGYVLDPRQHKPKCSRNGRLADSCPFSDALFFLTPCAFHSTSFVKEASRSHCGGDLNRTAISGARGTQGGRAGFDALGSGL